MAWRAHYCFLEQIQDASSVVHKDSIKPAAQKALSKIREHLANEDPAVAADPDDEAVKILDFWGK